MTQLLGFILLVLALVVHEAGHAIAMTRRGIEIKEAGIFFPVGKARLTFRPKFLPYPLVIGVIPLGAYVQPTKKGQRQLEAMSYKEQAICYSAGIITNIAFGCALIVVASVIKLLTQEGGSLTMMWICLGVAVITLLFRRFISVIMPILGILSLALIVLLTIQSFDNLGGPVAIVGIVAEMSTSWVNAIIVGGVISASIGQFNMIPFYPLDGGRVINALFEKWGWKTFGKYFRAVTLLIFIAFFLFVIVHDFL